MGNSFRGWYFKCQSPTQTLALIPAIHTCRGRRTSSIQIVTDTNTGTSPSPERDALSVGSSPGQTGTKLFFSSGCGASSSFPALPCGGEAPLRAACLASRRYYGPLPLCSLFGVPSPGLQHAASGHRPTLCQWKDLSLRSRSGVYRGGPRPLFSSPLPLDPVSISGRFPNTLSRRYPSGPDFLPRCDRRAVYF